MKEGYCEFFLKMRKKRHRKDRATLAAASASPGSLLEMQNFRPHLLLIDSECAHNKILRYPYAHSRQRHTTLNHTAGADEARIQYHAVRLCARILQHHN